MNNADDKEKREELPLSNYGILQLADKHFIGGACTRADIFAFTDAIWQAATKSQATRIAELEAAQIECQHSKNINGRCLKCDREHFANNLTPAIALSKEQKSE